MQYIDDSHTVYKHLLLIIIYHKITVVVIKSLIPNASDEIWKYI